MQSPQAVKRKKFKLPITMPLVKAIVVHLILVGTMMISFQFHQTIEAVEAPSAKPKTIQAKAISSADVEKMVQEVERKENAAKRAEQERKRRIQHEKDRKRKAAEDKKRREAEARKRKADADRKKREDAERKKREEAERKQREDAERKKREEAERKQREEAARIKAEQEAAARAAKEARALTERDKYTALIKSKISRNWIVGTNTGQCVLEVRLAPGGLILGVKEISGGADLCRSAKAAVYKSEPLPVASDPAVFAKMRTLRLDLDPREN